MQHGRERSKEAQGDIYRRGLLSRECELAGKGDLGRYKGRSQHFRSALELLKMMDQALDESDPKDDEEM